MNKSTELIGIGMPNWGIQAPYHALALIAGMARDTGYDTEAHDLNIDFYHAVSEDEKKYWNIDNTRFWFEKDFSETFWEKYCVWLHERIDHIIEGRSPKLIAFSVNMSNRFFSINAAKYIKTMLPDIPIMFGGVDCFSREQNTEFLDSNSSQSFCDIICQGEAEVAFPKYLERFRETGNWKTDVRGFAYYDEGKLVNTGGVELPMLRDKMPIPAYELFDFSKYEKKGALPFYLSRGCVYKCDFCSEGPNFQQYRFRDADEAFAELMTVLPFAQKHTDVPHLSLADSILNANIKQLRRFVELIIENDVKIVWAGQGHIHNKMDFEFLSKMKRSGFGSWFWGIESASQNVIDGMNKRYSVEIARRILDDCIKLGMQQHVPLLLGHPSERPVDLVDTVEFILEYKNKPGIHIHGPTLIILRPNSPLYDNYMEYGLENNLPRQWSTTDKSNTLPIRVARKFIGRQANSNHDLSLEGLVDDKEINNIDFDSPLIAKDVFQILFEVFRRSGSTDSLTEYLEMWRENTGMEGTALTIGMDSSEELMETWMKLDKQSASGRNMLFKLILSALKGFKHAINVTRATNTED